MKTSPFDLYKRQTNPNQSHQTQKKAPNNAQNDTIKGVLLNQYIKKQDTFEKFDDFDRISCSLLIPDNIQKPVEKKEEKKDSFDYTQISISLYRIYQI